LTSFSPTSALLGQIVAINAQVLPAGAPGKVTFMDGASVLGVASLNAGGIAQLSTTALAAGAHSIRAVYGGGGGGNFLPSLSALQSYTITSLSSIGLQPAVNYQAGQAPSTLLIGDFNGDNKVDLAIANVTSNNVSVLLGNGNGTFQSAVNYGVGNAPYSAALSDINGDGKLDIVTANQTATTPACCLSMAMARFKAPRITPPEISLLNRSWRLQWRRQIGYRDNELCRQQPQRATG
jgi:hypothetical protein